MMDYLYGELDDKISPVEYEGKDTTTAQVIIDNDEREIRTKVPLLDPQTILVGQWFEDGTKKHIVLPTKEGTNTPDTDFELLSLEVEKKGKGTVNVSWGNKLEKKLEGEISEVDAKLTEYKQSTDIKIQELETNQGELDSLKVPIKGENLVDSLNKEYDRATEKEGELNTAITTETENRVNEDKNIKDNIIGDLDTLNTTDKTSVVNAINENFNSISANSNAITVIENKNIEQDTAIETAQNTADTAQAAAKSAQNTADNNTAEISTIKTNIATIETNITNIEADITGIKTKNSEQDTLITNAQQTANNAASAVTAEQSRAEEEESKKVDIDGGELKDTITTFSDYTTDNANIVSGEKTSTIFGKIKKWFSRLKSLAFKDTVATTDIEAKAVIEEKLADSIITSLGNADTAVQPSGLTWNNILNKPNTIASTDILVDGGVRLQNGNAIRDSSGNIVTLTTLQKYKLIMCSYYIYGDWYNGEFGFIFDPYPITISSQNMCFASCMGVGQGTLDDTYMMECGIKVVPVGTGWTFVMVTRTPDDTLKVVKDFSITRILGIK